MFTFQLKSRLFRLPYLVKAYSYRLDYLNIFLVLSELVLPLLLLFLLLCLLVFVPAPHLSVLVSELVLLLGLLEVLPVLHPFLPVFLGLSALFQ